MDIWFSSLGFPLINLINVFLLLLFGFVFFFFFFLHFSMNVNMITYSSFLGGIPVELFFLIFFY